MSYNDIFNRNRAGAPGSSPYLGDIATRLAKNSFQAQGSLGSRSTNGAQANAMTSALTEKARQGNSIHAPVGSSGLFNSQYSAEPRRSGIKESPQQQKLGGSLLDQYKYDSKSGNFNVIGSEADVASRTVAEVFKDEPGGFKGDPFELMNKTRDKQAGAPFNDFMPEPLNDFVMLPHPFTDKVDLMGQPLDTNLNFKSSFDDPMNGGF